MNFDARRVETRLRRLFGGVRSEFSAERSDLVSNMLHAGEYLVAFETICYTLVEERIPVSGTVVKSIKELEKELEPQSSFWRQLQTD